MARRILQAEVAGPAAERATAVQLGARRETMRRDLVEVEKHLLEQRQAAGAKPRRREGLSRPAHPTRLPGPPREK